MEASTRVAAPALSPEVRILRAVAVAVPLAAVYLPLGLSWLALAVALALAATGARAGVFLPNRNLTLAVLFAAFFAWCALTLAWSVDPGRTLGRLPTLAAVLTAVVVLLASIRGTTLDEKRALALALLAGFALAAPFLIFERLAGAPLMTALGHDTKARGISLFAPFNRGLLVLSVMAWPAVLACTVTGRRAWAWGLGAAVLACVWSFQGTSVALCFTGAMLAFALAWAGRRPVLHAMRIAATLWILAAPFAFHAVLGRLDLDAMVNHVNVSVLHRFYIWQFSSRKVLERPLTGYGYETARNVPGAHQRVVLRTTPNVVSGDRIPLHTHDVPLQIWLELGLPGAVLLAAFVWLVFSVPLALVDRAGSTGTGTGRTAAAVAAAMLAMGFGVINMSYGAWQVWWQAAFALAAVFIATLLRDRAPSAP